MPRVVDRTVRRAEFASAAAGVFAKNGVTNTSVSDIVKAAGVAQGTFYLYFESKDDVVLAVVEQLVDRMVDAIEAVAADAGTATAVERMFTLGDMLSSFERDPGAIELVDLLHNPENLALHDRLAERLVPRLVPLVEAIVEQGVAEGAFDVPDTHAAAWFVLGGMRGAELAGTPAAEMPAALAVAARLALRALGYSEALS
jgi:AcrR family transcriptional regulator